MLCAGAGASSSAAAGPRAAVEAAVHGSPDDAFEGDKLNLAQNSDSASAADVRLGTCSTHDSLAPASLISSSAAVVQVEDAVIGCNRLHVARVIS